MKKRELRKKVSRSNRRKRNRWRRRQRRKERLNPHKYVDEDNNCRKCGKEFELDDAGQLVDDSGNLLTEHLMECAFVR